MPLHCTAAHGLCLRHSWCKQCLAGTQCRLQTHARTHARSRSTICCASMPLSTCCLTNTYTRGEHNPIWWSCLHAACMLLNASQPGAAEGAHDKQDALQDWVAGAAVSKNRHHHQCASTCSMDRRPQCALWSAANQTYINRGQCARAFC